MNVRTMHAVLAAGVVFMATVVPDSFGATALFNGKTVELTDVLDDPTDLWVTAEVLTQVTGFEVKPEGACLGEICIPLRDDLTVTRDGTKWINATALAGKVQQAVAHDVDNGVWSFGQVPAEVKSILGSAIAPDFELTDREGNTVRLKDFRGKKVLLMTWASW